MHDGEGGIFIRYSEDRGLKTNKDGLKHRKLEPKTVDVYPIEQTDRCPVRLITKYLSMLPKDRKLKHSTYNLDANLVPIIGILIEL